MKLRQLEYLVKIVECGSITQAAQQLFISQPSLTKAVSALEEEYGIRILLRKTRGVELTPQGRDFVCYARGVLSAVSVLNRNACGNGVPRTRLFVASQQLDFCYDLMVRSYENNRDRNIYFNLVETERNDVARQVLNGQADLGFLVRTEMDSKEFLWYREAKRLDIRPIAAGDVVVAAGPSSPVYDRTEVRSEELEALPQAALDLEDEAKKAAWAEYGHYTFFKSRQVVFFNTVSACEHFLLNTPAVSFTSPWTTKCYRDPAIRMIPVRGMEGQNELCWLKRAGEPLSPTEAMFLGMVYRIYGKILPKDIRALLPAAEKESGKTAEKA